MRHIGGLENITEKIGLLSVKGITKYEGITREMLEICSHIVQLRVPSYVHIVVEKYEHLCIQ